MRKIRTLSGQTLADVAVRESGSLEALFDLAGDNGLSVTDALGDGLELETDREAIRPETAGFFGRNGIFPATGREAVDDGGTVDPPPGPQGIGYWVIGSTFKVTKKKT
ncbi:hypothetical protein FUAX_32920 [Fulvitalea axinellae]|uniref:Uncharacterized protein n=1 Tax=Fulvitalea axinellae TaxID=1182444 RepID=A0AAU9DEF5_9BACT|nr:hypothetical protein FUAX_32920 [Fulvitalea axinellae]